MAEQTKWEKLAAPYAAEDIEWRVQQAGGFDKKPWALVLAYVTNRAIMHRLDDVIGPDNWRNQFDNAPGGGVMCGISILVSRTGPVKATYKGEPIEATAEAPSEWITKWDGADKTDIEATKGGLSNSMKRAAVQWGIGRYLYQLESNFVNLKGDKPDDMTGWNRHYDKQQKKGYYWQAPKLPDFALPAKATDE